MPNAMYSNGQRLYKMINNLLDLSKVESGQLKIHRLGIDLAELQLRDSAGLTPASPLLPMPSGASGPFANDFQLDFSIQPMNEHCQSRCWIRNCKNKSLVTDGH